MWKGFAFDIPMKQKKKYIKKENVFFDQHKLSQKFCILFFITIPQAENFNTKIYSTPLQYKIGNNSK